MMKTKKNIIFVSLCFLLLSAFLAGFFLLMQRHIERRIAQRFYLGENLVKEGKWEEAAVLFEELSANYPKSRKTPAAIFYQAFSLEKLGRRPEAYVLLNKVIDEFPESDWVVPGLLLQARIEKLNGEFLKAQKLYERVTADFKESPFLEEAWLGLGEIYEEKGELAEAKSFYERVIEGFPEGAIDESAREHLGNLQIKMIFSSYPSIGSFVYKVSSGDSLEGVARRFNTTVDLLKEANHLKSKYLSVGRRLKITPCQFNILVSKSKNILVLKYKDEVIKIYSVATGKFNSTPVGDFKIVNKLKNPVWFRHGRKIPSGHPDNILGSHWLGISEPSYGIHGTTQPESIGQQSTEGCIRMLNKEVEELFKLVTIGTPVKIID